MRQPAMPATPRQTMGTRCGSMIDSGLLSYPCTLPIGHQGPDEPHYAVESDRAVRAWRAWFAGQSTDVQLAVSADVRMVPLEEDTVQVQGGYGHTLVDNEVGAPVVWGNTWDTSWEGQTIDVGPVTVGESVRPGGSKPQREGDQPPPIPNDEPDIQSMVIKDMEARRQVGISRYGTALQPFNGRDGLRDLYEELLDGLVYAKQVEIEDARIKAALRVLTEVVEANLDAILYDPNCAPVHDEGTLREALETARRAL